MKWIHLISWKNIKISLWIETLFFALVNFINFIWNFVELSHNLTAHASVALADSVKQHQKNRQTNDDQESKQELQAADAWWLGVSSLLWQIIKISRTFLVIKISSFQIHRFPVSRFNCENFASLLKFIE